MIRINLLGQARPRAAKKTVPLEATVQLLFLAVALGLAVVILSVTYLQQKKQLDAVNKRISDLHAEKATLQQIKADVDRFESQKAELRHRIDVIETLQKNRTGRQEEMDSARGESQVAEDKGGGGPVGEPEGGAAAPHRRDRDTAEEPHRRA